MGMLIRIEAAEWVDPEEIVAIDWNSFRMEECPRIVLRNGHHINATTFQRQNSLETADAAVERLLMHISKASRRAWEQSLGVEPVQARYPEADPATPEGEGSQT